MRGRTWGEKETSRKRERNLEDEVRKGKGKEVKKKYETGRKRKSGIWEEEVEIIKRRRKGEEKELRTVRKEKRRLGEEGGRENERKRIKGRGRKDK